MKKGKLIVIDGMDGSGKATQVALLAERLERMGKKVMRLDFPRYEDNLMGRFIGECLAGKHGDFVSADPYLASTLYAVDRFQSSEQIKNWLKKGMIVILDRYVSANQIHQGGKIRTEKERKNFLSWIEELEYGVFGLPRPDAIIYLNVPIEITQALVRKKGQKKKKVYLRKGGKDTVEDSLKYLKGSRKSALSIIQKTNTWIPIACAPKGSLLSRESVSDMVWAEVKNIL